VGTDNDPMWHETAADELDSRVTDLEVRMNRLRQEVCTSRLVVSDDQGSGHLVAQRCNGATELWIEPPSNTAGERTGVLVFAITGQGDLCAGIGVQLWAHGGVVREMTWWGDERLTGDSTPA